MSSLQIKNSLPRRESANRQPTLSLLDVRHAIHRFTPHEGEGQAVVRCVRESDAPLPRWANNTSLPVFPVSGVQDIP